MNQQWTERPQQNPEQAANQADDDRLAQKEPADLAPSRPDCHVDPNFPGTLANRHGEDVIDSDPTHKKSDKRQNGDSREQAGGDAADGTDEISQGVDCVKIRPPVIALENTPDLSHREIE